MTLVHKDTRIEAYDREDGCRVVLERDNTPKHYYSVFIKRPGEKGKTIATKCTYETAIEKAKEYKYVEATKFH